MKGNGGRKFFDILGRKKIVVILIIIIIILSITTVSLILQAIKDNQRKDIVYTEQSLIDYKVYLKENNFFEKEYLESNKQYIATLIDYIEADFKYQLSSSEYIDKYKYKYRIVAETVVEAVSNSNTIYKFNEELVPEKILERSGTNIIINEKFDIDYNKYNDIIKEFISLYNLNDINTTVTIKMYVNVDGITKKVSTPVSSLVIPLTTKTVAVDIESNSVNQTDTSVYKKIANKDNLYLAVLTFILTVLVIIELFIFTNDTKDETAIYKMKIKKLLLNYDSYIQKINNEFNYDGYQIIEMKTFEDLLQIRDTISQPILMMETVKDKVTDFIIPSKNEVLYVYKLKSSELKKKK